MLNHCSRIAIALVGILALAANTSLAADPASVEKIISHVKSGFSDFQRYCSMPDAERRQTVVKATMALAGERQVVDPFVSGAEAGNRLRQECGKAAMGKADLEQLRWTTQAKALEFTAAPLTKESAKDLADYRNRLVLPAGAAPHPVVVLSHTAGGVSKHLQSAAEHLLSAGYGVFVLDTYGPRGFKPGYSAAPAEFARDAYDALRHLATLSDVDAERIFLAGYSSGALAAALIADPAGAAAFGSPRRYRASVGHYGTCAFTDATGSAQTMQFLSAASDRPVMMLMGAKDIETPPSNCFPLLDEMKAAGKPVSWHIYPDVAHAWDKAEHAGYIYRSSRGESMAYRYDAEITGDANRRMIAFFDSFRK